MLRERPQGLPDGPPLWLVGAGHEVEHECDQRVLLIRTAESVDDERLRGRDGERGIHRREEGEVQRQAVIRVPTIP